MRRRIAAITSAFAVLGGLAAPGCGGEGDPGSPVPVLGPEEEKDAGVPLPDASADAAPTPIKRTITQRNPFGNVTEADNLLWDGDFEWSSPLASQYGWLAGSAQSLSYDFGGVLVGASCRSGIKCAALAKNRVLVGIGVSSKGHKLSASFWSRVTVGPCAGVEGELLALFSNGDPTVSLAPATETPDESGWCHYEAVAEERTEKTFLFIKNATGEEIIVDDAVLKRVPNASAVRLLPKVPTPEAALELEELRASLRALRGPQDPPPNEARRALSDWSARRALPKGAARGSAPAVPLDRWGLPSP